MCCCNEINEQRTTQKEANDTLEWTYHKIIPFFFRLNIKQFLSKKSKPCSLKRYVQNYDSTADQCSIQNWNSFSIQYPYIFIYSAPDAECSFWIKQNLACFYFTLIWDTFFSTKFHQFSIEASEDINNEGGHWVDPNK